MGIGHGIAFRPQSTQPLSDTGVDTDEELDNSETAITMDADASSAIVAGNVIRIEDEDMLVTSVVTVTVNVERGYANSKAISHPTNQDVFVFGRTDTVLWLPGQDDPQSAVIRDRSGFGNDGAITGALWARTDKRLRVLDFDGDDDRVTVTADTSLDTSSVTFMGWMKATATDDARGWTSRFAIPAARFGHICDFATNQLRMRLFNGIDANSNTLSTIGATFIVWTHIAFTFLAATKAMEWVVNGVSSNTGVGAQVYDASQGGNLIYGRQTAGGATPTFMGQLALFSVHGVALTVSQIAGRYQQERRLFGV